MVRQLGHDTAYVGAFDSRVVFSRERSEMQAFRPIRP